MGYVNNMSISMNCLKCLFLIYKKNWNFCFLIYIGMENQIIKIKSLREKNFKKNAQ